MSQKKGTTIDLIPRRKSVTAGSKHFIPVYGRKKVGEGDIFFPGALSKGKPFPLNTGR